MSGGQEQAVAPTGGSRVERAIVLVLFLALVGLLVFILLTNRTFNETSERVLHLILSMVGGLVGAFLPGAVMHVEGGYKGLSIRATGGAGFFALVFFGLPWVMKEYGPGPISVLLPIEMPDLRAAKPDLGDREYLNGGIALILPVGFTPNSPAVTQKVTLKATLDYGEGTMEFLPYHVTALSQGVTGGGWIPNTGNLVGPFDMAAGEKVEIAFYARSATPWQDLVARLVADDPGTLIVTLNAALPRSAAVETACRINFGKYRDEIIRKTKAAGRYPARISMRCLP